jgi:pimeloyl-ACP methyl ester carboxylesterase
MSTESNNSGSTMLSTSETLEWVSIGADNSLPPIVFLHEGLGSVAMWRDFPARLCAATGRTGFVYSRRGYGQSASIADVRGAGRLQPDYMHREAWAVLPDVLKQQGIQRPVLLGHSDGGTIALLHASRFECEACIVMAPHLFVEEVSIRSIEAAREAYLHGDLRARLSKFHADVDVAFWQWNDVWLSDAFRRFNIEAECARIRAPILAIQGHDDPYGTMAQVERIFSGFNAKNGPEPIQNARHQLSKLEHCGHSPHRDQTEQVIRLVQGFLQRITAPG